MGRTRGGRLEGSSDALGAPKGDREGKRCQCHTCVRAGRERGRDAQARQVTARGHG